MLHSWDITDPAGVEPTRALIVTILTSILELYYNGAALIETDNYELFYFHVDNDD